MPSDLRTVKDAAAGKWPDILAELGGLDPASLTGQHGPCPRCGGVDRFRCIDAEEGVLFCNQCFSTRNGDGLAAVGWLKGWTLPESIDQVAKYLRLNGHGNGYAKTETPRNAGKLGVSVSVSPKASGKTYPSQEAAIAAVCRSVGQKPTGQWDYHNVAGQEVAVVLRFDLPDGKKEYRPVSRLESGAWHCRAPEVPRPLYRLHELAGADRVFVCEGEKASDAGRSVGLRCATSMNGAQAPQKTDWTPLAGRECILVPDADAPGETYLEAVAGLLSKLDPVPRIRVLRLDGLEEGEDLFDWLEARDAIEPDALAETLNRMADDAPGWQPSTPGPDAEPNTSTKGATQQRAPTATWQPFPVDCLPEPVSSFIVAASTAIGCDECYLALPLLAGLAGAIGNARTIELKHGWREPSILWACVVAESGTQKSPAMETALRPIRERQRRNMRAYCELMAEHKKASKLYEKDLAIWKRTKSGDDPPEEPIEPVADRTWCDDTTLEKLACILVENERGILCAKDELAGWLGSFDRYSNGKGGDVARWLEMWGGRSIVFDRKTGNPKTIYVPRASVSLAGCCQPAVLRRCMGPEYHENGLAARLLLACPPRQPKHWTEAGLDWTMTSRMDALFSHLYDLEMASGCDGPEPVALKLDGSAKACWVSFYNEHAQEAAKLSGELAAVWAKLEAYGARLALVVHLVRVAAGDGASPSDLDAMSIASGVTLARWFGHEARRVYSMLAETPEDDARRGLVELIGRLGGKVTARDFRHHGFKGNVDESEEALNDLAKHDYGRWESVPPGPSGGRPTRVFILND